MSAADLADLEPFLTRVDLPARVELLSAGQPIEHVHFLESGLASLLTRAGKDKIEVGLVGFDGLTGASVLLGATHAPFQSFVQVAGTAFRIRSADIVAAMARSPTLQAVLLRAVHASLIQIAQTALANGRHTVEQRLARWLLMAHDRLEQDDLAMTHEFLALMLGVRRPGVTVALHILEGAGAVRARRGVITVLGRDILKTMAGTAYGETEAAVARLFDGSDRPDGPDGVPRPALPAGDVSGDQNAILWRNAADNVPSSK